MVIAKTTRLNVREFEIQDSAFILQLLNTPSWLKYIGDRHILTEGDAVNYLERGPLKSYAEHGFGLNLVELKDGTPVGMCGLIKRETLDDVDIGFAFLPGYEGQGFAFESAAAILTHARSLNISRIVAITLPGNKKSIRLLERLNMKFEKMIRFPKEENELMLFSVNFNL